MKRYLAIVIFCLFLSSCDDGDLVYESLNFSNAAINKCDQNELYFKTNANELLLVRLIAGTNDTILNDQRTLGREYLFDTSANTKIYYRSYNGTVTANTICDQVPPAFPQVDAEYTSIDGGQISVIRNMQITPVESTTGTPSNQFDVAYNFSINFINMILTDGTSELKYERFNFGTYQARNSSSRIEFNFNQISRCGSGLYFSNTTNKLLHISLFEAIPNAPGSYTFTLNEDNYVSYRSRRTTFPENFDYCETSDPAQFSENWVSNTGTIRLDISETGEGLLIGEFFLPQATFAKAERTFDVTELRLGTMQIN